MSTTRHLQTRLRHTAVGITVLALVAFPASTRIDRPSGSEASKAQVGSDASANRASSTAWVQDAYAKLPLSFEANLGQTDAQVDFLARGGDYTVFLAQGHLVLALRAAERPQSSAKLGASREPGAVGQSQLWGMRLHLSGVSGALRPTPEAPLPGLVNHFIGNDPSRWRAGVPTYARVRYPEVYPGVDLLYYGDQGRLEFDFVLRPGASPSAIALRYEGADGLRLDARGDLLIRLGANELRQTRPVAYQEVADGRRAVDAAYRLGPADTVALELGAYDPTVPLVIDPSLVYSTFLGGSGDDQGWGVAVDAVGSAYVAGSTGSPKFPTTVGSFQTANGGGHDAFVTKLKPDGSGLLYSTYIGGSLEEAAFGVAVDAAGGAYITGATNSTNFPTAGAFQPARGSANGDVFVTKIRPDGAGLLYSTYLGGSDVDSGRGIAVDGFGNAHVTGFTSSTNFPTAGAFQTANAGGLHDAFVTKLKPDGSGLLYSTYLGGSSDDSGRGIAVDTSGNAYVTGETRSTNFPMAGAFQAANAGTFDAFVTKFKSDGSGLLYSTYLGGSGGDVGLGIAVDAAGSAYASGFTSSTNFPTTPGAFQAANAGGAGGAGGPSFDAFVTKLKPDGSGLVYSTYLGGTGVDEAFGIAVDAAGSAYVTGFTKSTNFPTADAFQAANAGASDVFVTRLNSLGNGVLYSTYLGGGGDDEGHGIAVDASSNAYVAGFTNSTNFPTSPNAFQPANGGGLFDAFVAKISPIGPPAMLTLAPAVATNEVGTQHLVTATVKDASGNPTPNVTVVFNVDGAMATFSTPSSGSATTDANGEAEFSFTAALPGANTIRAFADANHNGTQNRGEPFGEAAKLWTPPASTEFCEVIISDGGFIVANNGDRASFGGKAKVLADGSVQGHQQYTDHGPAEPLKVISIEITATTCNTARTQASIFGKATIDGAGSHVFRIDVTDEPDSYGITLETGYLSGQHPLSGGRITIH